MTACFVFHIVLNLFCRNKAVADYLSSNGFVKTLAEFQKEADLVGV